MNKEICKICWVELFGVESWDEYDDRMWEEGDIDCVCCQDRKIEEGPPDKCPYKMEHLVIK